ncbi:MAG: TlpA disulfide reductase family protein [Polyangiaceae bacterium]
MKGVHHLFGVVICAALASVACGDQPDAKSATGGATLSSGTVASDFSAQDTNGATLHLSDYLGKDVVLLDFWATWCQPCLEEMPHLRRIYEANKSRGFVVIGVSMDGPETVAEVPSFAQRNRLTFPIVLDQDSHVASVYNPRKSAPLSVLIDRSGKVVMVHEGYNPGDEQSIAAEIEKALAAAPQSAPPAPATPQPAPSR